MKSPADYHVRAVDRALDILECFSREDNALTATEIGARVGLHKSTLHRFLVNLEHRGYLKRDPQTGRYSLGLRLFELGSVVWDTLDVHTLVRPIMHAMVREMNETGQIVCYDDGQVIYIDKLECSQSVRMVTSVGLRLPAYCTASGKVLLSYQPPEEVERVIARGLVRHTPNTITDPERLHAELAEVRRRGYAVDFEEVQLGLAGVAAPIYDFHGQVVAALSLAGPVSRLKPELERYVTAVVRYAAQASAAMGCPNIPQGGTTLDP